MSLRFGSGWLVMYFLICSCAFICSAPQLRARDYTTFNPFEPLPFSVTPDTRGFGSLDREGAPQAIVAWGTGPRSALLPPSTSSEWRPSFPVCSASVVSSCVHSVILTDERFLHFQPRQ